MIICTRTRTLARKPYVRHQRGRHLFPPTFRDEKLSFSGTSRIFSETSAGPPAGPPARPYVRKNRMTDKTKDSWLVESDNFRFQVRPFFFRVRRPPKGRPVKKRVFAFSRNLLKESFAEKKFPFINSMRRATFVFRYVPDFVGYVVTRVGSPRLG